MLTIEYTYPNDPKTTALLLFGVEFKMHVRRGRLGHIAIPTGDELHAVLFDQIICDACNAEVRDLDPCCSTSHSLYCWDCAGQFVLPHTKHASRANPFPSNT